jgi:hypothetical protein
VVLTLVLMTAPACAGLIDDIDITGKPDTVVAKLRFTAPMAYVRHHPPSAGEQLFVALHALETPDLANLQREQNLRSPPNNLMTVFRVRAGKLPGCNTDPRAVCLWIRFDRPVSYQLQLSADRRNLLLTVPRPVPPPAPGAEK